MRRTIEDVKSPGSRPVALAAPGGAAGPVHFARVPQGPIAGSNPGKDVPGETSIGPNYSQAKEIMRGAKRRGRPAPPGMRVHELVGSIVHYPRGETLDLSAPRMDFQNGARLRQTLYACAAGVNRACGIVSERRPSALSPEVTEGHTVTAADF